MIARVFPHMHHYIWANGQGACAEGTIDVDAGAGCWEQVEIRIDFEADYPSRPPRVYDLGHRWKPELNRHLLKGHEFCLWLAYVDMPDVSTTDGLREFLLRIVPFLRDQFVFDDIGHWPGPEWRHTRPAAYAQHVLERLGITDIKTFDGFWPVVLGAPYRADRDCPCGSRMPYGRCHRGDVHTLHWLRTLSVRSQISNAVRRQLQLPDAA